MQTLSEAPSDWRAARAVGAYICPMARESSYPSETRSTGVQPRVWRSENKVLAGVIGGLAERLNVSPTSLRWFSSIVAVLTGFFPVIVAYVFLWAITRVRPSGSDEGLR
jgi:phage shock protein C